MVCRGTPFRLFGTLNCSSSGGAGLLFIASLRSFVPATHFVFGEGTRKGEYLY